MTAAVRIVLPQDTQQPVPVADVLDRIAVAPAPPPFANETLARLEDLSRRLLSDAEARRHPDLQALGYWLRPAHLARMRDDFRARLPRSAVPVPRGLVFHVPPANVGTLFAYGWALALLTGNRNVVRLPTRGEDQQAVLLRLLGEAEGASDAGTLFLRYGHDDAVSAALSRAADVRVIWGGDATVAHFRALPLSPRGLDVAFPDRFSWAALSAEAVAAAEDAALARLAEGLARDLFWFGQKACSSPRLLVWCGCAEAAGDAAARLYPRLGQEGLRLLDRSDIGGALSRRLYLHQAALDLPVAGVEEHGALAVLRLAQTPAAAAALKGSFPGGGVLADLRLPTLAAAAPLVDGRDQTLVHWGLPEDDLTAFAQTLNGRGLDRLVPVGEALAFDTVWDGVDLLAAFTRLVTVRKGPS